MSRPRNITRMVFTFLASALCAWGLAGVYFSALSGGGRVFVPLCCAGVCLLLSLLDHLLRRRMKGILLLGYLGLECLLFFTHRGLMFHLFQGGKALYLEVSGVSGAFSPFARDGALLICLFFSLISYGLFRENAFGFTAACTLPLLLIGLFLSGGQQVLFALPVVLSLLLCLSASDGIRLLSLLLCPVIALSAWALTPSRDVTYAPLEQLADDIRNLTEDYFFFTDTRDSFSMYRAGFMPLRDRLGGTAQPHSNETLRVQGAANTSLYLRAAAYDTYSGLNWYDTLSGRRYLFSSGVYQELRDAIFDMHRPSDANLPAAQVQVTLLDDDATTLFVPQRLRRLEMQSSRMVPYFNDGSEVYITRNLTAGDAYTVLYLPLDVQQKATRDLIRSHGDDEDLRMDTAMQPYLTVPGHIQQEVRDLAAQLTNHLTDPLDKALAVRDYLRQNYRYDLSVTEPPSSVDFVAYFLLGPDKAGYCTYFASALTMLCRMAGVPARYVVGYLAKTDDQGQALLTGQDAHAWTEVYLNGVGWITLDATPGNQQDWEEEGPEADSSRPDDSRQPTPTPDVTPTPTPAPDLPSPSPDVTPTPTPSEEPAHQDTETPAPSPAPDDTHAPTPEPENNAPEPDADQPFPWLWLLLLLLVAGLILWYIRSSPDARMRRRPDRAGDIAFRACVYLLAAMKLRRRKDETLLEFASRAEKQCGVPLMRLYAAVSAGIYGRSRSIDRRTAENALRMLLKKASPLQTLRMRLRMMTPQGSGSAAR